jgi:hypothetical protein
MQVVARRWALLDVFYTESGAYPRAVLGQVTWQAGPLYWVSSPILLHVIFAACFLVSAAFAVGFGTRYVKWLLLLALVTVDCRHPVMLTGGECVLHGEALFAVLLPLERAWSVDVWLRARRREVDPGAEPTAVRTLAYPLLLAQLAVIYFFCMLAKFGASWHDGSAVAEALGSATLATDLGGWVLHWPGPLLHALTYGTRVIEGSLPLLILSPWARRYTHALAGALMLALHGGIYLALEVGSFSVAMLCYLPLLWHPRGMEDNVLVPARRAARIEALAVAFLVYLMVGRLTNDLILWPDRPRLPMPIWMFRVSRAAGFLQPWMMFGSEPPDRDFIIVTDAVTRKGRHLDPWRYVASGPLEPLKVLPQSVVKKHVFARYEGDLATSDRTYLHPFFSRWVLSQHAPEGEPIERFDSWLMIVSTLPGEVVPVDTFEKRVKVLPLPLTDSVPTKTFEAQGVWAPERAFDRKIVPEGTHVLDPVGASMSAGCPHLTVDLGEPHPLKSAYIQADAADHFWLEGSVDGQAFHQLAEMPVLIAGHYRSRIIELPGEPVRFVRVRPVKSRGMSHFVSELALFDHPVVLPPLPEDNEHQFISALDRPAVAGIVSGSNHPRPECPAENLAEQFRTAPKP